MHKGFLAFLAAGLIGCLPKPDSVSGVRSITGPDFKGKKYYFAFNGGDTGSMSPTVFEPMFDAANLGAVFSRSSGGKYSTDIEYDTTKVNGRFLLSKLDEYASRLGPDDMFIMYTGSHGSQTGLYLGGETIEYEKIVEKVMKFRAKEVIIFMMACHSGAFSNAITSHHAEYAKWSREGRTLFVLASSQASQTSSTFPQKEQENADKDVLNVPGNTGSAYGNVLWRAIRGDADVNADKRITLKETFDYVTKHTEQLAGHRPAFAGDFPHNLVLTLVEGTNSSTSAPETAAVDALVAKIKDLEKKMDGIIARIQALNAQLYPTPDETPTGDGQVFAVIQEIKHEKQKTTASTPTEVERQGSAINQLLGSLTSAINQVVNTVVETSVRVQLQTLNTELAALRVEYGKAVEELRLKVAENLAGRP